MCFVRTGSHKISKGRECFKTLSLKGVYLYSPIWHTNNPRKLGDTIKAADMPKKWYHKFLPVKYRRNYATEILDNMTDFDGEVVHAFTSIEEARAFAYDPSHVIVKCVIPEKEVYWEDDDEIAAFSIKLVEIVECDPLMKQYDE